MVDPIRIDHIRSNLKLLSRLRQLDKLKRKRQFRRDRPQCRHHAFQSLRSNHRDRLRPLRISHRQQKSRQTADMIRVIMCKTNHINRFKTPSFFGLQPFSFNAICVPSPQSISKLLPEQRTIKAVSHRYGSGIIPPVPSKHTSNMKHPLFY